MEPASNIGHLVTIENNKTGNREHLFLYITGNESADSYKKVVKGIRMLRLPRNLKSQTSIQAVAVTDFGRIEEDYPETAGCVIRRLPVTAFFDSATETFKERLFLSGVINVTEKGDTFFPMNRSAAVVTGSDFFDREAIVKKIWKHVENRQNVLVCGPRRFGKTSIMKQLEVIAKPRFRPITIDLESVFSPEQFIATVWAKVKWPNATEIERNVKAEERTEDLKGRWREQGTRILQILSKKESLLFLLDECPYMLDSFLGKDQVDREEVDASAREQTNQFVRWFKEQRKLWADRWAFVLTGSINLKPYLKDNGLDKDSFSDCKEVRVSLFDSSTVRTYIESLLLGQGIFLSDEVIHELVRLTTPGIPYFIQIIMNHVAALYRRNPQFSADKLRYTYQEQIIGPAGRRLFDTFERHFKRYGARQPGARAILKELSRAGDKGLSKQDLAKIYTVSCDLSGKSELDVVLKYLEYDFYIEKVPRAEQYRFASPILRDYWKKNQA